MNYVQVLKNILEQLGIVILTGDEVARYKQWKPIINGSNEAICFYVDDEGQLGFVPYYRKGIGEEQLGKLIARVITGVYIERIIEKLFVKDASDELSESLQRIFESMKDEFQTIQETAVDDDPLNPLVVEL